MKISGQPKMPAGLALPRRIGRLHLAAPLALGSGFYDLYLRRIRCQASLISKTTIITMAATRIGPANIANIVSILQPPSDNARERAERRFVPRSVQNSN
jgi:hypothetical protein